MERTHDNALTQMRNSIEKLGHSTQEFEDATLMRFLIDRSMDPNKAAKMFAQWLKWRSEFVPNGFIPQSEVQDRLDSKMVFLQGLTKNGNPLLVTKSRLYIPSKDIVQFKKFVVYLFDKTIASSFRGKEKGDEKMVVILDLQGVSYKNFDTQGFIASFHLLQAYYPERFKKLFILHVPSFFIGVWKIVARFLDKATLEKVVIVKNEDRKREIVEEIGEEVLPEEYGGRAKLVPIQDVAVPWLEKSL